MRQLRAWLVRLGGLFFRDRYDREFATEIESHLQLHIEDNLRRGMSMEEARRRAVIKLGGLEQAKESYRGQRSLPALETLCQDVRYGLRQLHRSPGFSVVAILTLALGIGATSAVFSALNGILLRPLPYRDPDRLVFIAETSQAAPLLQVAMPNFFDWCDQNQVFEKMAAFRSQSFNLTDVEEAERLLGAEVTADFFSVLGVEPIVGRRLTPEEDKPGGPRVVMLSYGLWHRRFGGRAAALGESLTLNGERFAVIGVMPPEFAAPSPRTELWVSLGRWADQPWMHRRDVHPGTYVYGRLKPGVTLARARADLEAVSRRLGQQFPEENQGHSPYVVDLTRWVVGTTRTALWILFGAVGLVLLTACANVTHLALARSATRQREVAIRAAIGASRGRLARQLFTESLLLAMGGGAVGLVVGYWGMGALKALAPAGTPRLSEVSLDGSVLLFTLTVTLLTGLLFGLTPAWQASRRDLLDTLKAGGRGVAGDSRRFRGALAVTEVALCMVLLVGAALMTASFVRLQNADVGLDPSGVLAVQLSLPALGYDQPQKQAGFFQQLVERLGSLPGVESAAAVAPLPLAGANWQNRFLVEGQPALPAGQELLTDIARVTSGYFQVMRIRLVQGRYFTEFDHASAAPVAIVDETLARTFWPGQDAVGRRMKLNLGDWSGPWLTIVGVVGSVKNHGADQPSSMQTYLPFAQSPNAWADVVLRSSGDPIHLATQARAEVRKLDRNLPAYNVRRMEEYASNRLGLRRLLLALLATFASVALILAVIGVYGLLSYSVAQRRQEIGVRMALGARRTHILGLVLGDGLRLTGTGLALGLAGAFASTRLLRSQLFGVTPTDPTILIAAAVLLVLVSLAACYLPARRAARVDPMIALRYE